MSPPKKNNLRVRCFKWIFPGIVLDDPSNTVSLYQELKDSPALYMSLLRDGDMVSLSVDLGDV